MTGPAADRGYHDVEVIEIAGSDDLAGAEVLYVHGDVSVGGVRLSHRHEQTVPAETWLIFHDLQFTPSGVSVTGDDGRRLYPLRVAQPATGRTRIEFSRPVSGTADLS